VHKNKSEWRKELTPLQYDVTRRAARNLLFRALYDQHAPGLYVALIAGNALFDSNAKFDSGRAGRVFGKPSPLKMYARKKISAGRVATE